MNIRVKVTFHGFLTKNEKPRNLELVLNVNDTIEKALDDVSRFLSISQKDLSRYILLINGKAVILNVENKKLQNDDVLTFVPIISGG